MAIFNPGFASESIAYALAAGLVVLDSSAAVDRDIERNRRRQRMARRAARFSNGVAR